MLQIQAPRLRISVETIFEITFFNSNDVSLCVDLTEVGVSVTCERGL